MFLGIAKDNLAALGFEIISIAWKHPMSKSSQSKPFLRESISLALHEYFSKLDGASATNIYHLVLAEVEAPLLEIVMHYAQGNQSRAAKWLGLNRGTLRKLLAKYGLA